MVPSFALMYCLNRLLIFTVAFILYIFSRQFLCREQFSLSLQLHCLLGCVLLSFGQITKGHNKKNDPPQQHRHQQTMRLKWCGQKEIYDQGLSEILKHSKILHSNFYLQPKINKMNNPGRSIISSITVTQLIYPNESFTNMKPLAREVKSYILYITEFHYKISDIIKISHDTVLVTMDVRALYFNIKHNVGL